MVEIKKLLEKYNTQPKQSLGQNFLANNEIAEKIAHSSFERNNSNNEIRGVIEIGPGLGALTVELCKVYNKVAAIEIDRTFEPHLHELSSKYDNLSFIFADFLKVNLQELIEREFSQVAEIDICANLPYYITTPIILKIIRENCKFGAVTIMIQKEAADKLCAKAGTANYCETSVLVSYFGEAKKLFNVPSSNFYPQPNVMSSIVQIIPRKICIPRNEQLMFKIINAAFEQRRKTLVNAIASHVSLDKQELASIIKQVTGNENIRGERLDIKNFSDISDLIDVSISSSDL